TNACPLPAGPHLGRDEELPRPAQLLRELPGHGFCRAIHRRAVDETPASSHECLEGPLGVSGLARVAAYIERLPGAEADGRQCLAGFRNTPQSTPAWFDRHRMLHERRGRPEAGAHELLRRI